MNKLANLHHKQDLRQDLIGCYEVVGVCSGVMSARIATTAREERVKVCCISGNEYSKDCSTAGGHPSLPPSFLHSPFFTQVHLKLTYIIKLQPCIIFT